ncbi:MAG: hypothetical protein HOW73_00755 [Polyangiaceae bacterium]|nr:hypothetical protein [Polyangiaceae bacterium]
MKAKRQATARAGKNTSRVRERRPARASASTGKHATPANTPTTSAAITLPKTGSGSAAASRARRRQAAEGEPNRPVTKRKNPQVDSRLPTNVVPIEAARVRDEAFALDERQQTRAEMFAFVLGDLRRRGVGEVNKGRVKDRAPLDRVVALENLVRMLGRSEMGPIVQARAIRREKRRTHCGRLPDDVSSACQELAPGLDDEQRALEILGVVVEWAIWRDHSDGSADLARRFLRAMHEKLEPSGVVWIHAAEMTAWFATTARRISGHEESRIAVAANLLDNLRSVFALYGMQRQARALPESLGDSYDACAFVLECLDRVRIGPRAAHRPKKNDTSGPPSEALAEIVAWAEAGAPSATEWRSRMSTLKSNDRPAKTVHARIEQAQRQRIASKARPHR